MNRAFLALLVTGCISSPTDEISYTGQPRRFVVDAIEVPKNNVEARAFGLHIDNDKSIDNQLGMVTGTLNSYGDITTHGADMIAAGAIASSVELVADDDQNDPTVALRYFGTDGEQADILGGELVDGAFVTSRSTGLATVHLPIFVDADPSVVRLQYARIELAPDGNGGYDAIIGGGIDEAEANAEAFAGALQMLAADWKGHLTFFELLDTDPRDFTVTRQEWDRNSLIEALMAPDLDIDGHIMLSFGFRVHLSPCAAGRCSTEPPAAPCFDRAFDGDESDVDCGGSCGACTGGATCSIASDCESNACDGGICRAPSCSDGVRDGLETDIDCGGLCGACTYGKSCWHNGDCLSGQCGPPCSGTFCGDYSLEKCQ